MLVNTSMRKTSNKKINIYFISIVITLGGLLFGYDTGVINGTQFGSVASTENKH